MKENFEGHKKLLSMIEEVPSYGNNIKEVDELAKTAIQIVIGSVKDYPNTLGGWWSVGDQTITAGIPLGKKTEALPCGRLSGDPLTDATSPRHGKAIRGPTKVLKSASKLPHHSASIGMILNLALDSSLFESEDMIDKMVSFSESLVELPVYHVQFNVTSNEILRDAIEHPENHQDLVVRVAGYTARFVDLDRDVQEDIIERVKHTGL